MRRSLQRPTVGGALVLMLLSCARCAETPSKVDTGAVDRGASDTSVAARDRGAGRDQTPASDAGLQPIAGGYFPAGALWYQDQSKATVDARSPQMIAALAASGGWGQGNRFLVDFSIEVLEADGSAPFRAFTPNGDHYSPDCDTDEVPVPPGGALEAEDGYACTNDGDCHLIVVHRPSLRLFEMWRANIAGSGFDGGCLAVWDMRKIYGEAGRGHNCTSADAAGLPITPLLFSADEVQAGEIKHAIRFILPNDRVKSRVYVYPGTHSTNATSGGADSVPYGVHLRLKASFDESKLKPGAQVVARALKKYGMFHADGGQVALTARSDRFTTAKWAGLLAGDDLASIKVTDFEVIDHGAQRDYTGDCQR